MGIPEIFHLFNLLFDGGSSLFSPHAINGLSTIMFVIALVVVSMERHKITKDADRIEQMDEYHKKKYMLISYINMGIPLIISVLLEGYYFYDRIFIKGDLSGIEDLISAIIIVAIFIIVMILFRKKPKLKKKVVRKLKKSCGITPNEDDYCR